MQAIQLAAGDVFRDVGMSSVAESPPLPAESLSGYRKAGRAWVAVDDHDEPVGFVVELENGFRIYHAGDTHAFGDMALIRELFKPDLAMLPIGGHYTMDPAGAALAALPQLPELEGPAVLIVTGRNIDDDLLARLPGLYEK